ncbi:hypothetical protein O3G_MSEX000795 [Manduca sexta]|nr:hypothetical protein O3G_MSEX000795 [Manduca sexta]
MQRRNQGTHFSPSVFRPMIGGEPIAISGTNSRLRADTEQKNPNITLPDPGFKPRSSERCRTAHAVQLRHRGRPDNKRKDKPGRQKIKPPSKTTTGLFKYCVKQFLKIFDPPTPYVTRCNILL